MDVGEALKRRRSTRHFEPEGVLLPRELIEDLIQEACQAPSEFDLQPWRFIVVRDRERKEVLYQCCFKQPMIRDASAVVIVLGDTRGHERAPQAVEEWVAQGVIAAPEAPRVEASIRAAYDGSDWARMLLAVRNPCFAAMSLMLLATGNGIATSPVVAFAEEALRRAFHIPARFVPVLLVAMGMPSTVRAQPGRVPRETAKVVVHHEDMDGAEG